MRISGKPIHREGDRALIKKFLLEVLKNNPNHQPYWPDFQTFVWIDGYPRRVSAGNWQITSSVVYLAGPSQEAFVPNETQVAVLAAIAEFWELGSDSEIKEALVGALVKVAAELWVSIQRVNRPAVDNENSPIEKIALKGNDMAGLVDGIWRKPNGEAVAIGDDWVEFALEV